MPKVKPPEDTTEPDRILAEVERMAAPVAPGSSDNPPSYDPVHEWYIEYNKLRVEHEKLQAENKKLRKAIEAAINDEPECPGKMPDEMWEKIKGDRDAAEEAYRIAIRLTKEGIMRRYKAALEGRKHE